MIKGAIFDMDGLMFDTERLSTEGWIKAGIQMQISLTEDFVAKFRGTNIAYSKALFKKTFGEDFDYDLARSIRTAHLNEQFRQKGAPVKKGLFSLLNWLTAQGIPCAVATSTRRDLAEDYLRQAGVLPYFSFGMFGDMVTKSKPDPEIFIKAAEGLQVDIKDCVVFEDSPNGILAGKASGAKVIAIPDITKLSDEILDGTFACLPDLGAAARFLEEHVPETTESNRLMRVTYIGHSGFLVELPAATLLFDYYVGEIPPIRPEYPIYVFASHSHSDHFNPVILSLKDSYPEVHYFFANEISSEKIGEDKTDISFLAPHTDFIQDKIHIQTLASTDLGVAFLVDVCGKRIFHAGDLNWWTWIGEETEEEYTAMTKAWKEELALLADLTRKKPIDLSFMLLDPRQGERFDWGMHDFLRSVPSRNVLPMHCQEDYGITARFLQKEEAKPYLSKLFPLSHRGEVFYLY